MKDRAIRELEEEFANWVESLDQDLLESNEIIAEVILGKSSDRVLFQRRDFYIGLLVEARRQYSRYCTITSNPHIDLELRGHNDYYKLKANLEKLRNIYHQAILDRGVLIAPNGSYTQ